MQQKVITDTSITILDQEPPAKKEGISKSMNPRIVDISCDYATEIADVCVHRIDYSTGAFGRKRYKLGRYSPSSNRLAKMLQGDNIKADYTKNNSGDYVVRHYIGYGPDNA